MPPIPPVFAPVTDVFPAITPVFEPVANILAAIADVFEAVAQSAVVARIATVF